MLELPTNRLRRAALLGLSALFVLAGVNHFVMPALYVRIMPEYLPFHRELVLVSGVMEIAGGLAVLAPRLRSAAGWFLVVLLVAVFPANLNMAQHPERFASIPTALIHARLPLQALLVAWAWWATRPED